MLISSNVFLESFLGLVISVLYLPLYYQSRGGSLPKNKYDIHYFVKFILCFCINFIVCSIKGCETPDFNDKLFYFLIMIIADIDMLIMKIPSEFLILLFASALKYIIQGFLPFNLLTCLLVWVIWLLVREKVNIGMYDTILILIFSLCSKSIREIFQLNALFLIFYGFSGLVLKYFFKKSPETKIPLAPLIISAAKIIQLIN